MQQPSLVYNPQRRGNLLHQAQRLLLRHALLHAHLEVALRQILHRQVLESRMHAVVVYLYDRRIADGHDCGVLALEELPSAGLIAQRLADFQRDIAPERGAGGQVHGRFFGLSDQGANRVAGDQIRNQLRHRHGSCAGGGLFAFGLRCRGRLHLGLLRENRQAARDALLDPPLRDANRSLEPIRVQQPLGNVIRGAQLQRSDRGQLIAFFRDHDDRRRLRLEAQAAQPLDALRFGIFRAGAEGSGEDQDIALLIR